MPGLVRLGDICTGHSCYPPRRNIQGSLNVFVNGRNSHRFTDVWNKHCCGDPIVCHTGVTIFGSITVFVNGLGVARQGDPVSCGSFCMECSISVFNSV